MTEEKEKTSTPPADTDKAPAGEPAKKESWSKEEHADYTRKTQELAELQKKAEEAGCATIAEHQAKLEAGYVETVLSEFGQDSDDVPDDKPPDKQDKAEQVTEPKKPEPESDIATLRQEIKDMRADREQDRKNAHAEQIESMRLDYVRTQTALPEAKRNGVAVKEILDCFKDPTNVRAAVIRAKQLRETTGHYNIFETGASLVMKIQGSDKLKEQGAMERQALIDAQKAATGMDSIAAPPGEDEKDDNAKRADEIVKDDPPYEMS